MTSVCLQNKDIFVKTKICFPYNHSKEKSSPRGIKGIISFVIQAREIKHKTKQNPLGIINLGV